MYATFFPFISALSPSPSDVRALRHAMTYLYVLSIAFRLSALRALSLVLSPVRRIIDVSREYSAQTNAVLSHRSALLASSPHSPLSAPHKSADASMLPLASTPPVAVLVTADVDPSPVKASNGKARKASAKRPTSKTKTTSKARTVKTAANPPIGIETTRAYIESIGRGETFRVSTRNDFVKGLVSSATAKAIKSRGLGRIVTLDGKRYLAK